MIELYKIGLCVSLAMLTIFIANMICNIVKKKRSDIIDLIGGTIILALWFYVALTLKTIFR